MTDTEHVGNAGWTGTILREEGNPSRWYVKVELVFDRRVLRLNADSGHAPLGPIGREVQEWLEAEIAKS